MAANGASLLKMRAHRSYYMACLKDKSLQQSYDAALRAWRQNRGVINEIHLVRSSSRAEKDLLTTRLDAAYKLYEHGFECTECSASKLNSGFDVFD
jgi:hypothetical protein